MRALVVLFFLSCGSLVENEQLVGSDGGATGGDGGSTGLFCANDDPCLCDPCTSTTQCMTGLACLPGRRKGMDCADGRSVCTTGP